MKNHLRSFEVYVDSDEKAQVVSALIRSLGFGEDIEENKEDGESEEE